MAVRHCSSGRAGQVQAARRWVCGCEGDATTMRHTEWQLILPWAKGRPFRCFFSRIRGHSSSARPPSQQQSRESSSHEQQCSSRRRDSHCNSSCTRSSSSQCCTHHRRSRVVL